MKAAGVFAFERSSAKDRMIVIANFSDNDFAGTILGHDFTCKAHDGVVL